MKEAEIGRGKHCACTMWWIIPLEGAGTRLTAPISVCLMARTVDSRGSRDLHGNAMAREGIYMPCFITVFVTTHQPRLK